MGDWPFLSQAQPAGRFLPLRRRGRRFFGSQPGPARTLLWLWLSDPLLRFHGDGRPGSVCLQWLLRRRLRNLDVHKQRLLDAPPWNIL